MSERSKEAGLKTRHVFLDTEVYRRYGHNLSDKVLQRLLQLTKDHICELHITDITLAEVEYQLSELATEVAQAVNKANRLLRNWRAVRSLFPGMEAAKEMDLDATTLAREAARKFRYDMNLCEPTQHPAMSIPAKGVFDAYFQRLPPFDKPDSKEFPDAFVVAALNDWCRNKNQRMYIVTKDKAMLRAASQTERLLPISTVEDFLSLFVDDPNVNDVVERVFDSPAWDIVEERVRDQLSQLGTVYSGDLDDGEVIDHRAGNEPVKIQDFDVISASDKELEVVAKVDVSIEFDVQYLDTSSATWDSEDKVLIGGEREVETFEVEKTLSILVTINSRDETISEVDLLTRDVSLSEPYENYK